MKGSVAWLNYLRDSGVRYSHSIHPRAETALETADAERMPAHEFTKCVVYFCETGSEWPLSRQINLLIWSNWRGCCAQTFFVSRTKPK
jgi:hypothetical protein